MNKALAIMTAAGGLALAATPGWTGEPEPPLLKVLVASGSKARGDDFEAFLKARGVSVGRLDWEALSKEKVQGYDVVLLDPDDGVIDDGGQSKRPQNGVPADLGKPVMAVGAAGSYALIPFKLKFGNNG